MCEEGENIPAPNWLSELEAKREKRVRRKLGHEAGAGAPCLTCGDKCPGLDLHFWRKICKICKCSKENHDVHDDDIYGWAQFQLLGQKPNKIKHKIVLPGKKDEVELDWAPTGQNDTINSYLKTLPPETLPVKGSQAAQERKQLLQKQIPIHDLDPHLCHDLTESELQKMYDYIEHMKTKSVGVGQVVQLYPRLPETSRDLKLHKDMENLKLGGRNFNQNAFSADDVINSNTKPRLPVFQPLNALNVENVNLEPNQIQIGAINDINYDLSQSGSTTNNEPSRVDLNEVWSKDQNSGRVCKNCRLTFDNGEYAIFVERSGAFYHPSCFKCIGCNQNLADMIYFYDAESDGVYCGRDFAKIRGIPRCRACDELIFLKEYCLAEHNTFHVKHFCCFECDLPLAGQNYLIEEGQPLCLPCFEQNKANRCEGCSMVIKPDEQGANLNGVHFHATPECFACKICRKPLLGAKLLLRNRKLYCSHDCYGLDSPPT